MLVSAAIGRAFLHAQGKATAPASGTPKYNALLAIADSMQKLWASEPDTEWDSLYSRENLTAVITVSDSIALDDTIQYLSKREGESILLNDTPYTLVKPSQLYRKRESNVCAQIGRSLKFPTAFAADSPLIGATVEVPAILYTTDITDGTNTIEVDDPMWLVYMMAAEFARNNIIKAQQYDNLLAYAEQSMTKMKQNNGGQLEEIPRGVFVAGESWV
jgi:hypothetical protein